MPCRIVGAVDVDDGFREKERALGDFIRAQDRTKDVHHVGIVGGIATTKGEIHVDNIAQR